MEADFYFWEKMHPKVYLVKKKEEGHKVISMEVWQNVGC